MVAATEEAVTPGAANSEEFGSDVHNLVAYFYTDDRILALKRANHLQQEFYTLMELFDCVGLHTNVAKMASTALQICHVLWGHSAEAYGLRMMGKGKSLRDRLQQRFH